MNWRLVWSLRIASRGQNRQSDPGTAINRLKVLFLRLYYRALNAWNWRGKYTGSPWRVLSIPGPAGNLTARIHDAYARASGPVILFFHGGGWTIGDLDTHHPFCQELAYRAGATVVALEYRLAPEHPYPAVQEDCLAAAEWLAVNLDRVGPNNGRFVIAGDSAGGHLTACSCLALSDGARARVAGAVVFYPLVDHYSAGYPSYEERANDCTLTADLVRWFVDTYLAGTPLEQARSARPLLSERLGVMPPLFSVTAEFDPLRDEGRLFAEAVAAAGVPVRQRHFPHAAHGFACGEGPTAYWHSMMADLTGWLSALTGARERGART
jgi:acetyl esterase